MRTPNNDVANTMVAGKFEKRFNRLFRLQSHDFGAQVSGPLFVFQKERGVASSRWPSSLLFSTDDNQSV